MYRFIFRPLLFLLSPETVHHLVVLLIKILFSIPGVPNLVRSLCRIHDPRLERHFLGMKFSNPVGLAAGFDKNGMIYNQFFDFGFSHIEVGTVTPKAQPGNTRPRSFRIPRDMGLINRMGFNNRGLEAMVEELNKKRRSGLMIGGNIGKNTATPNREAVSDYEQCFRELYTYVDYFVVNVSCPNITDMHELQDQDALEAILSRLATVRREMVTYVPMLLKISPDLNNLQIEASLHLVDKYGIDGIVATNTTIVREGLSTPDKKVRKIGNGGMSGAPLTARSLEVVKLINKKTEGKLPIIGVGGIMTAKDAVNMLNAGATLIQVYTGFIYNGPAFVRKINKLILSEIS